jgi:predicted enzyme related to lactoylglutathione lyase
MHERKEYPAGVPCWIDTAQPDPEAAAAFYRDLFGWELEDQMPAGAPGHYFMARLRGRVVAAVGSQPRDAMPAPAWNTYISVESADRTAAKVEEAGGSVLTAPFEVLDSGRMGVFRDPSGAVFSAWEANQHTGAQLVNEPGTWNWSTLNTPDPEQAKTFYGEVFGWVGAAVSLGEGEATMWRLPGYADFLERSDPDLRRRHAQVGAPEGFSDAVAWMAPADGPAHWSVTFAIDDADAIAARAVELGGRVLAAPSDAGMTRVAVLGDPRGAAFSVSHFEPR